MDVLIQGVQEGVPWCMLFADDIVLIDDTREGLNDKLELWRLALETKGFRISTNKTEYMECRFSGRETESQVEVRIDSNLVPKVDKFRYLGSVIQADGELDGDVGHRVGVAWAKWRLDSRVLCDPKISPRLKGMEPMEDKFREARYRWYGHVRWRNADAPVQRFGAGGLLETASLLRSRGMGSLFPLVVRRKGIFLWVEVLECGISEQVLLRLVGLEFSGCNGLLSTFPLCMATLIYKIKHEIPFNLGKIIFYQIMSFASKRAKQNTNGLPYPLLIFQMLKSQRLEVTDEEEPAPPLLQVDLRHFEGKHYNYMVTVEDPKAAPAFLQSDFSQTAFIRDEIKLLQEKIYKHWEMIKEAKVKKNKWAIILSSLDATQGVRVQAQEEKSNQCVPEDNTTQGENADDE
ncbi:unnamed protein product [Cuscuta campestris]|uniref:Reverse transcriptase domain-containing protein n=1 Tax=Cuscuta campestris TaxID=132261 RepID=A0A484M8V8_9ASTE|nr:unnamed protein product [Cuscuta campestris]